VLLPRRSFVRGSIGLLGLAFVTPVPTRAQDQAWAEAPLLDQEWVEAPAQDQYFAPAEPGAWMDVGPGRFQAGWQEIVVSLDAQRLWAYEAEQTMLATWVSTGTAETPEVATPLGHYRILVKKPMETMEGTVSGEAYRVEDVPHVMYFTNEGHALHGTYWHSNFGARMSHGCVNLPLDVADWMYHWAPEGTPVSIVP
jgi:lipoprotein-anchoring transpeptidase ErfK/SrfK